MHTPVPAICLAAALAAATPVAAQTSSANREPSPTDNYYAAGNRIEIRTAMAADVIVAGRQVDIGQPVAGDILAAGWRVALSGHADDDVRIAAAEVAINAPVAGDLTVAGRDVYIGPQTHVSGRSWLTGRTIRIEGVVERDLQVAGANVELAGEIRKPVHVVAEKLAILSSARILAPLTYKGSTEARIAEGAVVNGPISVLGLPIGLAMGAVYAMALFAGVLTTAFFVGDAEARLFRTGPMVTRGQRVMLLLAGVLTLAVLRSFIGGLIVFASVLFGFGALALLAYQAYARQSVPGPA